MLKNIFKDKLRSGAIFLFVLKPGPYPENDFLRFHDVVSINKIYN